MLTSSDTSGHIGAAMREGATGFPLKDTAVRTPDGGVLVRTVLPLHTGPGESSPSGV